MLRRVLVATVVLSLTAAAGRADALTVRDIVELSKAGLGDSVLLTLIDVERSVFSIDTATLKQLKAAGVSDAVIVAMIRSGREPIASGRDPIAPERADPGAAAVEAQSPESLSAVESAPRAAAAPVAEPAAAESAPAPGPAGPLQPPEAYAPAPTPYATPLVIPVYVPLTVVPVHGKERHEARQPDRVIPPNCLTAQIPIWGFGGTTHPQQRVCH